jgi:aminoglycoside phosphotransferase (APT) family kinase protein
VLSDRHERGVVVFRPPAGVNLAGCMVDDFMAVPQFLAAFGRLHARLHALPLADLAIDDPGTSPLDDLLERADIDPAVHSEVDTELTWLDKYRPADTAVTTDPAASVLCHGELNPLHVYVADGDVATAVPVNWTRARHAEPAFDVAATVTAFWTSPLYVTSTVQRTALKVIRDSLISAYLEAYTEAFTATSPAGLDDGSLRYWQAFHLASLATDVARRLHDQPVGLWDAATSVANPAAALRDLRDRFWDLAEA